MRIVFAGTPDFAATVLERLHACDEHDVVAVYTRPDRRKGRGRKDASASPVKSFALQRDLAIEQPRAWDDEAVARLRAYRADCVVVIAYGVLLPPAALDAPTHACVNIHLSLLPRWRGAAPVARALLNGDTEVGVSLMRMDAGLDTGPIIARRAYRVSDSATTASLYPRLAEIGAELTLEFLRAPRDMLARATPQDEAAACVAPRLSKDEGRIEWSRDAAFIARQIRAMIPWPVARARDGDDEILLWEAVAREGDARGEPGDVLQADAQGIHVQCGRGYLEIRRLQLAGRRVLTARDFLNGRPDWGRKPIRLS